jgi:hypothetical protein
MKVINIFNVQFRILQFLTGGSLQRLCYGLDVRVSVPAVYQASLRAKTVSYVMGTGGSYLGGKAAGASS